MKILIIEDEYSLADAISETLKREGFSSYIATDGEEGENEALSDIYDLILLDLMLPRKAGFDILKNIRNEKINTPVIILTAKSEVYDKINGLEIGADDYVTKPFHMKELMARVKAILRRNVNIENTNYLEFGDLKLVTSTGELKCNDKSIFITGKELELLEILLLNKKQIVNKETIANKVWGFDSEAEYNNVEVYISFLRKKIKLIKSKVGIMTIRGLGYKMEEAND